MVMPKHLCPYGLKSLYLLKKHGYEVEDVHLKTKEETEEFKKKHSFPDTPRIYINGEHIGNDDDLKKFLGYHVPLKDETSYKSIIAIFSTALLLAFAVLFLQFGNISWSKELLTIIPHFISISMVLLALQKIQDVESFSTMFLNYDLLAQKWVPYSYIYPFAELGAGLLMLAGFLEIISIPVALFIGLVGAGSVYKAVYIDKRELKCACAGGNSSVPLGFVSLTENIMMVGMAIYMMIYTM